MLDGLEIPLNTLKLLLELYVLGLHLGKLILQGRLGPTRNLHLLSQLFSEFLAFFKLVNDLEEFGLITVPFSTKLCVAM